MFFGVGGENKKRHNLSRVTVRTFPSHGIKHVNNKISGVKEDKLIGGCPKNAVACS